MDDLLQFVPAEKQEEFKTLAASYIKADPEVIKKNQVLFDQIVLPSLKVREENIFRDEFPKRLEAEKEKIRKEFAPKDETPEQKELREMREWKKEMLQEKESFQRKEELRGKYRDIDADLAASLYSMDDSTLEAIMGKVSSYKSEVDVLKKEKQYGSKPPSGGGNGKPAMKMVDFLKLEGKAQAEYIKSGGALED